MMAKIVELTKGYQAIVDDEDFERVSSVRWYANVNKYGYVRAENRRLGRMHRFILSAPDGEFVDHRNGNPLDNRKANLRYATKSQNGANRKRNRDNMSGFRGVSFQRQNRRWQAAICFEGKSIYIGCFDSPCEAARAYDERALELFGEFARLNFPTGNKRA